MMSHPADDAFQISIFAPAGFQQALRLVEKDDWKGHALMCKRAIFPDIQNRPELSRPGVYILFGVSEDDEQTTSVYIGEGDPILQRLKSHFKQKDFWTDFICFSAAADLLSKSHIQYLEARLIHLAATAKRCRLDNAKRENLPTLSEAQTALGDRFLNNMLATLSALGIHYFNVAPKAERNRNGISTKFTFSTKGISAEGYESANGFVVAKGSTASNQLSNTFPSVKLRARLIEDGILVDAGSDLRFAVDFEFNSSSAAAQIIAASSVNGRDSWRLPDGTTLKKVQESKLS